MMDKVANLGINRLNISCSIFKHERLRDVMEMLRSDW